MVFAKPIWINKQIKHIGFYFLQQSGKIVINLYLFVWRSETWLIWYCKQENVSDVWIEFYSNLPEEYLILLADSRYRHSHFYWSTNIMKHELDSRIIIYMFTTLQEFLSLSLSLTLLCPCKLSRTKVISIT